MSLNYSNVNSNSSDLSNLPLTVSVISYNSPQGGGHTYNFYKVTTTLPDYDWRRADLKDFALALAKIWAQDPTNSRKKYYVLYTSGIEWPAGMSFSDKSNQLTWPNATHDASEIEAKHVELLIKCSDYILGLDSELRPWKNGNLLVRGVKLGFEWNLFGSNPAGHLVDAYGNPQPDNLNNGLDPNVAPADYWQYIWLPNNHINGDPPTGSAEITNDYYIETIDQSLIDNTIINYVADKVNNGLTRNTVYPTPPPTYSYGASPDVWTDSTHWTKLHCVTLKARTVGNVLPDPILTGTYGADQIKIVIDSTSRDDFRSIFQSVAASTPPGWIFDVAGYTSKTANFWNWYDIGSGDGVGFFPSTTIGATGGYSLGARIKGAKPGLITWQWDETLSEPILTLKGSIQLDEEMPAGATDFWDLEMCLLEYNAYTGPSYFTPPPPTYSYGTPGDVWTPPSDWDQLDCVTVKARFEGSSPSVPIPVGNYVADDIKIIIDPADASTFQQIFESISGSYPPGWILDAHGYPTNEANFWNWYDNGSGSGGFFPAPTAGATGGYALGAKIEKARPGLITWKWDNSSSPSLTLKGNIQVDEEMPTGATDWWDLKLCLLKYKTYVGPAYPSTSASSPPTIVSQTPAPGATNVPVNTSITITFDKELSLQASRTLNNGAGLDTTPSAINPWIWEGATYTYASKVLTITPTTPFSASQTVAVSAPSGIKDLGGNELVTPVGWQFTTAAPAVAPNLVRMYFFYSGGWSNSKTDLHFDDLDPAYEAPENLGMEGTFVFEFDKPIDSGTAQKYSTSTGGMFATTPFVGVTDYTAIINGPGPIAYAGSNGGRWWEAYDQYNIEPFGKDSTGVGVYPFNLSTIHSSLNAPAYHCLYFTAKTGAFLADHEYRPYIIPSLVTDTSNIPLGSSTLPEFTFNGRVLKWKISDSIAPTIVSITPAPGATNVPVNTPITIEFSEELDPASRLQTWVAHPSSQTYSSKVLTITPTGTWPGTTTINVTSPTGPILTDMSGNQLAAINWSFTTAVPPDTRVPIEAYAYGFSIDPDQFKSIPLTKSGSIDIDFKIPADDIDGSKIMYLRLRDENGLISPNYRISLRVNDVEFKTFEIDSDPYLIGSVNNVDVRFDIDNTDVSGFQYGYLVDDSSEPTTWTSPVITTNSINEYLFNFNLDVSALIAGEHELYVWIKTKEGEKRFRKINFVSEPAIAPPYGTLGIKRSMIEDGKKKVWVEANVFDDGVGVKELSLEDTAYPDNLVNINIIQNKRYLKIFEYDALDNSVRNYKLILVDAIGTYNATPITTSVDLSSVF